MSNCTYCGQELFQGNCRKCDFSGAEMSEYDQGGLWDGESKDNAVDQEEAHYWFTIKEYGELLKQYGQQAYFDLDVEAKEILDKCL